MSKKRIIPQMFDVRPVKETGDLDWERIRMVEIASSKKNIFNLDQSPILLEEERRKREEIEERLRRLEAELEKVMALRTAELEKRHKEEEERIFAEKEKRRIENIRVSKRQELERLWKEASKAASKAELEDLQKKLEERVIPQVKKKRSLVEKIKSAKGKEKKQLENVKSLKIDPASFFDPSKVLDFLKSPILKKQAMAFASVAVIIVVSVGTVSLSYKGLEMKERVLGVSMDGYASASRAISEISNQNFESSSMRFEEAFNFFSEASREMDEFGALLNEGSRFFPYISKISSGKNLIEAGKRLSAAGWHANEAMSYFNSLKEEIGGGEKDISLVDILEKMEELVLPVKNELVLASENIEKVKIDDLPEEMREEFVLMKSNLPKVIEMSETFLQNSHLFADMLGANGSRKYLFLFQNNTEIRATGGFIGSYGFLDISKGRVREFFIDGIYNPDGQLVDMIVPPAPIQKMIPNWTLHDSNWFPDFPLSAKKSILMYEKTGGPTVDGVIAITPFIMQKMLEITGPIEMENYGITLDADNFIEKTQYEVEEGYDKEENSPKKILSDLAPIVMEKLANLEDSGKYLQVVQSVFDGLEQKHVLIYSQDRNLQGMISENRWSGEILNASKDYLSVVNTNIGGHKTDAFIDEKIKHKAEIQEDGSIINTVTITRKHNGGNTQYEWWNKTNADYMRIYVPKGSKLISADGHTREYFEPPVNYEELNFKTDPDIEKEKNNSLVDEKSGTLIYDESGKTVFANWVYVEPQETAVVEYKYVLPFKLFPLSGANSRGAVDSYSLLAQKQSGSTGSLLESEVFFPDSFEPKWSLKDDADRESRAMEFGERLLTDKFLAIVFERK